ncbi:mRNA 3'-end-processing protein rna14 [Coelomomyces lativittatus]|nr:mRNA 3'-end-processing protein rna14 [Coelomomyces lativittatus]KAJ1511824.1 mRNA 3'-end-processing protein rna14 [Coelomomyces lativittatus]KAJ1515726.1 mRNA 3'-end-processing protein rna14 [Coelomomyces lativittatus]
MRYSVRAYGIEALRAVFKRARSHRYCTWPIIVASAHFEFVRTQNTTVPKKLFRYAIATYPSDPAPVLAFADWLIGINDQVNLVSELVKASQSNQLDSLSQFKIMDKLHDYYVQAGNFKFLQQQELEMSLKWPQWTSQLLFAQKKFRFGALTPLERDLGPFTSLGTPSTPSTVPSSHLNTLMMTSGPATSSMLLNNTDQETSGLQKRRILDEWVAPDHIPAPDTLSHRGWSHFKLPKKEEIKPTSTSSTSSSSSSSSSLSSTASASSSSLASSSTSVSATASSASTSNAAYTTMNNTSSANAFDSPKPKELPSSNYPHGHGHGQAHAHAHAHAHHPPPPPPSHFHSHAHSHAHAHESIPHSFRPLSSSTLGSSIPTDSSHLHASKPITSANLSMHHPTDTVMQLLSKLPSAEMFTGPYFDVHGVLNLIENAVHMPSMLTSTLSTHPPSSLPPPPPSLPPPLTSATPTSIQTASTPTPTSSSTPHPNPSVTSSSYFIDPKDPRRRKRVLDEVANVPSHPLVQKKYRLVNEHL